MKYIALFVLLILTGVGIYYMVQLKDKESIETLSIKYIEEEMAAKEISVVNEEEEILYTITMEELREYAHSNWDVFEEPPEVGMRPVSPDNFYFFDRSASISPNNEKLAFSVHDYAVLTEMSFVMIADIGSGEISMVKEPVMGSIEKFIWSQDSRLVTYALGTARAGRDFLSADDTEKLEKIFTLRENDLLEALNAEYQNGDGFMPEFRDLEWKDERIHFTTNSPTPEEVPVNWSVDKNGSDLKIEI